MIRSPGSSPTTAGLADGSGSCSAGAFVELEHDAAFVDLADLVGVGEHVPAADPRARDHDPVEHVLAIVGEHVLHPADRLMSALNTSVPRSSTR